MQRHGLAVNELLHSHEFSALNREGERRTAWVMWLTIVTMVLEIAAGFSASPEREQCAVGVSGTTSGGGRGQQHWTNGRMH